MHPQGALLRLPFFTTDSKEKFLAISYLTFHSWSLLFSLKVVVRSVVEKKSDFLKQPKYNYAFKTFYKRNASIRYGGIPHRQVYQPPEIFE
jgi:hypothetical protein